MDNQKRFKEPTDLLRPLNLYFHKQEECQRLAVNVNIPISATDMVLQLQSSAAKSGLVNGAYTK